jgi:hypothetical protein
MRAIDRRSFLEKSAMASALLLTPSVTGLISCADPVAPDTSPLRLAKKGQGGYGELFPSNDVDDLISIPAGSRTLGASRG